MNKLMEAFGEIAKLSLEAERELLSTIGCDCTSKGNIKPPSGFERYSNGNPELHLGLFTLKPFRLR